MTPMQHVAVYARISSRKDTSTSILKQDRNTRRVAGERFPGRPVVPYVDDGISAAKGKRRAGLDAMLDAVRAGTVAAVVIDQQDRLTRDRGAQVLWEVAETCEAAGAEFLGASEEIDAVSASGEFTVGVRASVARYEARKTGERVKATNAHLREQGRRAVGGPGVWGLTREGIPDHRRLTVGGVETTRSEVLADAVARVIASTLTVRGWAEELTDLGVPSPRGLAVWPHRTTSKILRSPALAGMIPDRGDVLRDLAGMPLVNDGALLTMAQWNALQAAIDGRKVSRAPAVPRRPLPLLHGLIVDELGHRMYRHALRGRIIRYNCNRIGCPTKTSADLAAVDALAVAAFLAHHGEDDELAVVAPAPARPDPGRLAAIRAEIARTTTALQSARDAEEIGELASRLTTLRAAEADAEGGTVTCSTFAPPRVPTGRTLGEVFRAAPDDAARREVLSTWLASVEVHPGRRGGSVPLADRVTLWWSWDSDDGRLWWTGAEPKESGRRG